MKASVRDLQQPTKLRIGIASSGRFHLLDLARELDALGMDVRFYSYVSRKRAAKFGLPERCHVALLPFLFPLVALERLFPRFIPRTIERLMSWALDLTRYSPHAALRCIHLYVGHISASAAICHATIWRKNLAASSK